MECAADQSGGAFWRLHDRFMTNGDTTARSRTRTIDYAAEIGLDVEPFTQCLDDQTHAERIQAGFADAVRRGVKLTPAIFVNEERSGVSIDAIRRDVEVATP